LAMTDSITGSEAPVTTILKVWDPGFQFDVAETGINALVCTPDMEVITPSYTIEKCDQRPRANADHLPAPLLDNRVWGPRGYSRRRTGAFTPFLRTRQGLVV
jgi:hypothetical protein